MQLHRSNGQSDWQAVPFPEWNTWQRLAERTHSVVTPGNLFTVLGLILVLLGLWRIQFHDYWLGLVIVAAGRFCDLLDGWLADRTGTKSPLGEKLDVGFDKLVSLAAFWLLVTAHVLPLPAALLLLLPNLNNTALTLVASRRNFTLHPSAHGKLGMAVSWAALGSFLLAACFHSGGGSVLWWLGCLLTGVALVYGVLAGRDYITAVRQHSKSGHLSGGPGSPDS